MNYRIIGGDGQEYGPVPEGTIREWIADGRLDNHSKIKAEGAADWSTVGSMPEFSGALAAPVPPPPAATGSNGIDIGACISTAFRLFQEHWLALVIATLVAAAVCLACNIIGLAGNIMMEIGKNRGSDGHTLTLIGMPLYFVGSFVGTVLGTMLGGGAYRYLIRVVRGGQPDLADLFAGFREKPVPLGVLGIVQGIAITIGVLLCVAPGIYLAVAYAFSIPLVMEKNQGFWDAMETSRKTVTPHWFPMFGLCLIAIAFAIVGALLCGVGLLAAYPICGLMIAKAYCGLFDGSPENPPANQGPTSP
ncbi:MAG TPA: GYF domain-containing protein [Verrucomicrobiae bacterium]|nr:GYF domain-containing protein [Verrucomicrobiae bacterium]